jgi:hypothetical protein
VNLTWNNATIMPAAVRALLISLERWRAAVPTCANWQARWSLDAHRAISHLGNPGASGHTATVAAKVDDLAIAHLKKEFSV